MFPFSVKLANVYPVLGVAVIVTDVFAVYDPDPVVVPPAGGLDVSNTANCNAGILVKLATNVLLPVSVNW